MNKNMACHISHGLREPQLSEVWDQNLVSLQSWGRIFLVPMTQIRVSFLFTFGCCKTGA